jgi:uncharacterized protein (TIGR03083 family)
MKLEPRYDEPVVQPFDDDPARQLAPLTRQRRRFETMLAAFGEDDWQHPSRCDAWTARDVIAHLVSVTGFWNASITAGLAGEPTRWLIGFDPAATPPQLVGTMSELSSGDVFEQFVTTSASFIDMLAGLSAEQWLLPAESPAGHVPIQLLAQHALWDSWIHERDVALPVGIAPAVEPDEVSSVLQFAAMVSPVLGLGLGRDTAAVLAVEATDPTVQFVLDAGRAVGVSPGPGGDSVPCLRGDAVDLAEALSLRGPLPADAPIEWRQMLTHLEAAFDQ